MDVEFLPPQRFSELDFPMLGSGGDGQIFTQGSGQPFDVITDLPTSSPGSHATTLARSGAVRFANPPQNMGQRSYPDVDRYFAFQANDTDVSLWGYTSASPSPVHSGQGALFNFKAIAKDTEARLEVFSGGGPYPNFYSVLVKNQESSFWGYASDNLTNYKLKADSNQVKYELWKEGGDYFATLVKSDESSFWGNSSSGYNYKTIADSTKASIEAWGDSRFIIISTQDLSDPNHSTAKFTKIFDGAMKETYALCTTPSGTPACADLGDPIVKDIYASNLYSHGPCTNNSGTYLSLENQFLQIKAGAAPNKITVDTSDVWAVTGGSTSAKFSAAAIAAYDGNDNTVMDAAGVTATSGSDTGNLNAQELWMNMSGVGITKVMGSEIRISKNNGGLCVIDPPADTTCTFRQATVCMNGEEKTAYILMSIPE